MKVMTIMGSPRRKGNTSTILGLVEEIISSEHEIDRLDITSCDVKGCTGCLSCMKSPDEPGCVQDDDAESVFERIMSADAVIYATPLYCWGFTAQMKALMDRHICLMTGYGTPEYKSLVNEKPVALLVSCEGPIENNADFIQGAFDRLSGFLGMKVLGKYIVPLCSTPDALPDHAKQTAQTMAHDIMAL